MNEENKKQMSDCEKTERTLRKLMMHKNLAIWDMRSELGDLWDGAGKTSSSLQFLTAKSFSQSLPQKLKSMTKMLVYLGLVESLGTTFLDMALMLLIANGKEMHTRGPYVKHVTSLKELRKLDLAYKLYFLRSHELPLFLHLINRELRNDIAHLKFKINNNGKIKDSKDSVVDIDRTIEDFWNTILKIQTIFDNIGFTLWLSSRKRGDKL